MKIILSSSFAYENVQKENVDRLMEIYQYRLETQYIDDILLHRTGVKIDNLIDSTTNTEKLLSLYRELLSNFTNEIAEMYTFIYEDEEYEIAPFLQIDGLGNNGVAYQIGSEASFQKEIICATCNRIKVTQIAPLHVNTSLLKNRMAIFVNEQLVISEKFARLLEEWGMKGYRLSEVIHKGNADKLQVAYQLIPTEYMPKCSEKWRKLHFYYEDNRCFDCNLTGFINPPYTYDEKDLQGLDNDFYIALEPRATTYHYYYHDTLISQRLRQKLLEYGITKNGKGRFDNENYNSKDWAFDPIVVV